MWGTATNPVDRVGSEWVSCAATQALSCTKQATMGGGQGGSKEKEEEFCHLLLAHLPSSCRMSFFNLTPRQAVHQSQVTGCN